VSEHVTVRWTGEGLRFEGETKHGRAVLASGLDEDSGTPTPVEMLAVALGACTGMDVVSILLKMRQPLEGFWVEVTGERAEEHPKRYLSFALAYHVRGAVDEAKLARAIQLSEERYCGVEATLRSSTPVSSRYEIHV
jgi:putative redox protein